MRTENNAQIAIWRASQAENAQGTAPMLEFHFPTTPVEKIMRITLPLPAVLLAFMLGASVPLAAIAQDTKAEVKTVAPMRDVLMANIGKRVAVRVGGDQEIDGTVTAVGASTVQLSKLAGKDFYDAVVNINSISAVVYKAR
jgi:hypothetical protein